MSYNTTLLFLTAVLFTSLSISCGDRQKDKTNAATDPHAHHQQATTDSQGYIDRLNQGLIKQDTLKGSPKRVTMENVGNTHVHLTYRSPGVKDRIIWGGLVPYGQVWVTGAHTATSIMFTSDITIDGQIVPAGTYAIFTIPEREDWTFILNKNYEQHLADDYKQEEDVLRTTVRPQAHSATPRLTYQIKSVNAQSGVIRLLWEKLEITVPFTTN
ncbi:MULTISPECIES: DUF2911 domain-containing protein [Sphingobacterium]|uniref:DUF2911 domain-containing protein n=1 Tax=Sphingobacterium populi TaxID=1812824 RepID=A0ABW5UG49_9SPHI|nr:DUF2911 domain-containing protein [Sphingobacterium sp. CFCC 11742]